MRELFEPTYFGAYFGVSEELGEQLAEREVDNILIPRGATPYDEVAMFVPDESQEIIEGDDAVSIQGSLVTLEAGFKPAAVELRANPGKYRFLMQHWGVEQQPLQARVLSNGNK